MTLQHNLNRVEAASLKFRKRMLFCQVRGHGLLIQKLLKVVARSLSFRLHDESASPSIGGFSFLGVLTYQVNVVHYIFCALLVSVEMLTELSAMTQI